MHSISSPTKGPSKGAPKGALSPSKGTKYAKADVLALFDVFNEYDVDHSGTLSLENLRSGLTQIRLEANRVDGHTKPLRERNVGRARGFGPKFAGRREEQDIWLSGMAESMFRALDANADGKVSFRELLLLMYPCATVLEIDRMVGWASMAGAKASAPLSRAQLCEIRSIFRKYDTDGSGDLSLAELATVVADWGLEGDELQSLFEDIDTNKDGIISFDEFRRMMQESGMFDSRAPLSPSPTGIM